MGTGERHGRCEAQLRRLLQGSPMLAFLLDATLRAQRRTGGQTGVSYACEPCAPVRASRSDSGTRSVFLCEDVALSDTQARHALARETLRLYDRARILLDAPGCAQLACTEVRAASLSGECRPAAEWLRGRVGLATLRGHHSVCVRERAAASLALAAQCAGIDVSSVLDSVLPSCIGDTAPFFDVPYHDL